MKDEKFSFYSQIKESTVKFLSAFQSKTHARLVRELLFIGIFSVLILSPFILFSNLQKRALQKARRYVEQGFTALAEDQIEPFRRWITLSPEMCQFLITLYFQNHNGAKLNWTSQACLAAKIETPETLLGLAMAQDFLGNELQALDLLSRSSKKFPTLPDFDLRIAQILKRSQKFPAASSAYLRAHQKDPTNTQVSFEVFQHFYFMGDWQKSRELAIGLQNAPTDNPEVKLMLSHALHKSGENALASVMAEQANLLLEQTPERRPELMAAYPKVFLSLNQKPKRSTPQDRALASPNSAKTH